MKRQARPFVVETKRSRKAPTNLWASTPLLQEELAAASEAETKADTLFGARTIKERARAEEPQRRILPSLVVEAVPAEEPEPEPAASRRRVARDTADAGEKPKRGRPRRLPAEPADVAAAPRAAVQKVPARATAEGLKPVRPAAAGPQRVAAAVAPAPAAVRATQPATERLAPRTRPAKVDSAALPPGQRWKRRLPQVLW